MERDLDTHVRSLNSLGSKGMSRVILTKRSFTSYWGLTYLLIEMPWNPPSWGIHFPILPESRKGVFHLTCKLKKQLSLAGCGWVLAELHSHGRAFTAERKSDSVGSAASNLLSQEGVRFRNRNRFTNGVDESLDDWIITNNFYKFRVKVSFQQDAWALSLLLVL